MYLVELIIKDVLKPGEQFKSFTHEIVCRNLIIGNPEVSCWDAVIDIVQTVQKVPEDRIKTITLKQLRDEFGLRYL